MGVNMVGNCICDDDAVREASKQEVVRRYYNALCSARQGMGGKDEIYRLELIMSKLGITPEIRTCAIEARKKAEETSAPAVAIELPDGTIVTGKTSSLLGSSAAALLNALKKLAGIDDDILLISPAVIEPIQKLKAKHMGNTNPRLHMDEVLIALSICAVTAPIAAKALDQLEKLKCTVDENVFKKLGVNVTCEPQYQTKKLYHPK